MRQRVKITGLDCLILEKSANTPMVEFNHFDRLWARSDES